METIRTLAASLSVSELVKGLIIAVVLSRFLPSRFTTNDGKSSSLWNEVIKVSGFFSLFVVGRAWLGLVDHYVPEPYLVSHPHHLTHSKTCH